MSDQEMSDKDMNDQLPDNALSSRAGLRNLVTRYRQWLMIGGIVLVVVVGLMLLGQQDDSATSSTSLKLGDPAKFSRVDGVDAEVIWIESAEERLRMIEERLKTTLRENAAIQDKNETIQSEITDVIDDAKRTIERQATIIEAYEAATVSTPLSSQAPNQASNQADDPFGNVPDTNASAQQATNPVHDPFNNIDGGAGQTGATTPMVNTPGVDPLSTSPGMISFKLTPLATAIEQGASEDIPALDIKNYLPAGAYAPAVIIAGAATQVSATGQADPKPVLIRITGDALSAATGSERRLKIDIKGCTITGEARGEISSERVYVRLQRMTCERDDGVIESNVKGYVSGSGQAGVRGDVISREGDLLDKSFTAGILSGFGNSVAQGLTPNSINQSAQRLSDSDLLENAGKAGLGKGIGNAGEKLSEYYIRRAEQYQPVVMLKGGTNVQVVFLEGVRIDGQNHDPIDGGGA